MHWVCIHSANVFHFYGKMTWFILSCQAVDKETTDIPSFPHFSNLLNSRKWDLTWRSTQISTNDCTASFLMFTLRFTSWETEGKKKEEIKETPGRTRMERFLLLVCRVGGLELWTSETPYSEALRSSGCGGVVGAGQVNPCWPRCSAVSNPDRKHRTSQRLQPQEFVIHPL
jgi:hypothetical protein